MPNQSPPDFPATIQHPNTPAPLMAARLGAPFVAGSPAEKITPNDGRDVSPPNSEYSHG
jgi:hypothetical protein